MGTGPHLGRTPALAPLPRRDAVQALVGDCDRPRISRRASFGYASHADSAQKGKSMRFKSKGGYRLKAGQIERAIYQALFKQADSM